MLQPPLTHSLPPLTPALSPRRWCQTLRV